MNTVPFNVWWRPTRIPDKFAVYKYLNALVFLGPEGDANLQTGRRRNRHGK